MRPKRRQSNEFVYSTLEPRQLLAAASPGVYEFGLDPKLGATVTAFIADDPENPYDSWDIRTNWIGAVDELANLGFDEVNFAVYRQVDSNGQVTGGPSLNTVQAAVGHAQDQGLFVSLLPVFETDTGWRGDYNPSGYSRQTFQSDYSQWIQGMAALDGVDRLTVASELNAMHADTNNDWFFDNLISTVANSDFAGEIAVTANFDVVDTPQLHRVWANNQVDLIGISAYENLIPRSEFSAVSNLGEVSETAFATMVDGWNSQLDNLETLADEYDLKVFLNEFGSVKYNYTATAPFAVSPGNWVDWQAPNRYEFDPLEQKATYESLLVALNGRGDKIEAAQSWSWEHGADRGLRSYVNIPDNVPRYINEFAIWPADNAGGEALTDFLATKAAPNQNIDDLNANDDYFANTGTDSLNVLENDSFDGAVVFSSVSEPNGSKVGINDDGTLSWEADYLEQALQTPDIANNSRLGFDLAIDGDLAAVGAPYSDVGGKTNNGSVLIYQFSQNSWEQIATVTAPVTQSGDAFGFSVDLQDNTLVVGAPLAETFANNGGAAFVFESNADSTSWAHTKTLSSIELMSNDQFGFSVSLDNNFLAVGSRFGDGAAKHTGTVSVFKNLNGSWVERNIVSSGSTNFEAFGWQVDLKDKKLAVGAPSQNTGSAYFYRLDNQAQIVESTEFHVDGLQTYAKLGHSIAIDGDTVVIGAPLHDANNKTNSGAVFVFNQNGDLLETITVNGRAGDKFGNDIAIHENAMLISASLADGKYRTSGEVYRLANSNGNWAVENTYEAAGDNRVFGHSLAISKNHFLVGATGANPGAALAFSNNSSNPGDVTFEYSLEYAAELLQSGNEKDRFGWSVDATDRWAVVGAPLGTSSQGVNGGLAYVFQSTNNNWIFHSTLTSPSASHSDHFGHSVAIDGTRIVVGSLFDNTATTNAGAAYVYQLSGNSWQQTTRIWAESAATGDRFGASIDVDGSRIVVGATNAINSGTVTAFDWNSNQQTWQRTSTLTPSDHTDNGRFGFSVSLDGENLAIGAPDADQTGQVHVFENNNGIWNHRDVIVGADSALGDSFGYSVSLDHGWLAVGANRNDALGISDSGAVYLFGENSDAWQQSAKLTSGSPSAGNRFGNAVELSDNRVLVGSPFADETASNTGASYLYKLTENSVWQLDQVIAELDAHFGSGTSVALAGNEAFLGTSFSSLDQSSTLTVKKLGISKASVHVGL